MKQWSCTGRRSIGYWAVMEEDRIVLGHNKQGIVHGDNVTNRSNSVVGEKCDDWYEQRLIAQVKPDPRLQRRSTFPHRAHSYKSYHRHHVHSSPWGLNFSRRLPSAPVTPSQALPVIPPTCRHDRSAPSPDDLEFAESSFAIAFYI